MKKSIIVILIGAAIVGLLFFVFKNNNQQSVAHISNNLTSKIQNGEEKQPAEKIEVVHFRATQQCWSCITVGEYALKTIKERFPEEYKNGVIVYKDINGELPENREMVMKYRAGGSSLYVNAITAGSDNIEEDVTVWRLIANEKQFLDYFEAKIKKILDK